MSEQQEMRYRDVLNWYRVFRDARTGRYVSRWFAMLHPAVTVSERRER